MVKGIYVICLVFVVQNVYSQYNSNECYTPNQQNGICINLKKCPKLKIMLETQRNNATIVTFLRKSSCGYDGKDPKVCCQLEDIDFTIQPITLRPMTQDTGFIGSSGYETITSSKLPSQNTCGQSNVTHVRIQGGHKADLGAWPWMAALGYQDRNMQTVNYYQWLCGGTLISDTYVLTAAHCTVHLGSIKLVVVRLGELNLNPNVYDKANPIDILVKHIITHEQYSPQIYINDIALLKLEKSVRFNSQIQPICLPVFSQIRNHKLVSAEPYVSGWGAIKYKGPTTTQLMEVQFPVIDNESCKMKFAAVDKRLQIDDRIICAGDLKGGKDACQGDSGGPLMLPNGNQYYLVGVVSYGYKCGEKGFPGVYTRTTTFLDWIIYNMNIS